MLALVVQMMDLTLRDSNDDPDFSGSNDDQSTEVVDDSSSSHDHTIIDIDHPYAIIAFSVFGGLLLFGGGCAALYKWRRHTVHNALRRIKDLGSQLSQASNVILYGAENGRPTELVWPHGTPGEMEEQRINRETTPILDKTSKDIVITKERAEEILGRKIPDDTPYQTSSAPG